MPKSILRKGAPMSLSTTDSFIDADRIRAAIFLADDMKLMQSQGMRQMHAVGMVSKDLLDTTKLLAPLAEACIYANSLMEALDDSGDKAVVMETRETLVSLMQVVNNGVKSVTDIK